MLYRRGVVFLFVAAFAVMIAGGASSQPAPAASCATFSASSEPSSRFAQGDRIIIRGTGFGPRSLVLINLQQGTRTVELARATANDLGAFRVTDAQIPQTVVGGKASIRALDAKGSATCAITLTGSAKEEGGLGVVYLAWGLALAAFGVFLGSVRYKRWKADRLQEAMEQLAHQGADEADAFEAAPIRLATRSSRRGERNMEREAPPVSDPPPLPDESFADEWAFAEQLPAGWMRSGGRASRPTGWAPDADVDERPRLPDEWDARPHATREPSAAIARLRREVRTWKRP